MGGLQQRLATDHECACRCAAQPPATLLARLTRTEYHTRQVLANESMADHCIDTAITLQFMLGGHEMGHCELTRSGRALHLPCGE